MKKAIPTTVYNSWSSVVIADSDPAPVEDLSDCDNITSLMMTTRTIRTARTLPNIAILMYIDVNPSSLMQVLDISDDSDNSTATPPPQTKGKGRAVLKYPRMPPCHVNILY